MVGAESCHATPAPSLALPLNFPMPRRKKSAVNPLVVIGVVAAIGLAVGGYLLSKGRGPDTGFAGVSKFNISEYLENSRSMQGNTYQVQATVKDQISITENGRLYSMTVKDEHGGASQDIPVLFSQEFAKASIQKGAELSLKLEVDRTSTPVVRELKHP